MLQNRLRSFINRSGESFLLWVPLGLLIGVICGVVMFLFTLFIDLIILLIQWLPVYFTIIIGGGIISIICYNGYSRVKGSGVNEVILQRHYGYNFNLDDLLSKFFSSAVVIGTGGLVGREGPSLYIGATIADMIGEVASFDVKQRRGLGVLGGAAATAALFQTPLGAALFAIEIPYKRDLDAPAYIPALLGSISAYFTYRGISLLLFGEVESIINISLDTAPSDLVIFHIYCVILGVIVGISSIVFSLLFQLCKVISSKIRDYLTPLIGAAGAAIVLFIVIEIVRFEKDPRIIGSSGLPLLEYFSTHSEMHGLYFTLFIIIAFLVGVCLCVGFGLTGGVFGPSLLLGGGGGIILSLLIGRPEFLIPLLIVGMSAGYSATAKTPIASMIFVLELTNFPPIFIGIAVGSIVAYFTSGKFTLYSGQQNDRNTKQFSEMMQKQEIETKTVNDLSLSKVPLVSDDIKISSLSEDNDAFKIGEYVVQDNKGKIIGVFSKRTLHRGDNLDVPISEHLSSISKTMNLNTNLHDALHLMEQESVFFYPVTDGSGNLIGVVQLKNILALVHI